MHLGHQHAARSRHSSSRLRRVGAVSIERQFYMSRAMHLAARIHPFLLLLPGLFGQTSPAGPTKLVLKSGTPVTLAFAQTISSAHAHKSDQLDFVVAKDVAVGGFTVIRAGAPAEGSVVGVTGKRPLGIGGNVIVKLDSVELTNGERIGLVAQNKIKGKSHTFRMGVELTITAAVYPLAAPILLLSRGRDCTVLKGTEVTAYTKTDSEVVAEDPIAGESVSELSDTITSLPPRVLNREGIEGDMLNLIFVATKDNLQEAFASAGWQKADKSKLHFIWHLLWQGHYRKLPMEELYVFGREQDYSYTLPDPGSIAARRHHLRIWKTQRFAHGVPVWVGAATHDVAIELAKFRLFHKIDPDVDAERDFIAGNLAKTRQFTSEEYLNRAKPVFSAQTATGQTYHSDSRMLLLDLNRVVEPMPLYSPIGLHIPILAAPALR